MQAMRIAFKNISRQFKRTLLLGGAIAFGFLVFTLINGFTSGLLETVEQNFADLAGGHIYISGTEVSERGSEIAVIRDTAKLEQALTSIDDQLISFNVRSSALASLIFGTKEEAQFLFGVNFDQETEVLDSVTFVKGNAVDFLANPKGVLLPEGVVDALGIEVGESIVVKVSTINGQQNVGDLVVLGSIKEQNNFGFETSFAHIGTLNTLLDMSSEQYQTLSIYTRDLIVLEETTERLYNELASLAAVTPQGDDAGPPDFSTFFGFGGLNTIDEEERWQGTKFDVSNLNDQLQGINQLVTFMNSIGLIIFLVILVIIMVGITNSYRMVMLERTAEIGTMRAMGIQKSGIRNIFIWESFLTALAGAVVGLILALLTMFGLSLIDFGSNNDFSFFLNQGHLQFNVTSLRILLNAFIVCVMSVAAVYIPARAAANLKPADALRASY